MCRGDHETAFYSLWSSLLWRRLPASGSATAPDGLLYVVLDHPIMHCYLQLRRITLPQMRARESVLVRDIHQGASRPVIGSCVLDWQQHIDAVPGSSAYWSTVLCSDITLRVAPRGAYHQQRLSVTAVRTGAAGVHTDGAQW